MGRFLEAALERSRQAERSGALVPLQTEVVPLGGCEPFVLRRLLCDTPKHLRSAGPKPNPFLPWDPELEVSCLSDEHVLILNKFPVQRGHVLLIPQRWQPQSGWLSAADWQALAAVEADTPGLWFFNSCAAAGASQPHRHLQLLPREPAEPSCPLAAACAQQLRGSRDPWPWLYRLSPRLHSGTAQAAAELEELYQRHQRDLGLGAPDLHPQPQQPYNLILEPAWFMTVVRTREHWAGMSINALGFAGCLLITPESDTAWLQQHGPLALLQAVAGR
ncbi:ATP adenylyltransferase [Synechococcus sp. HK05]|uniref:ATP adenylyltransferase n=1 Tax=Synechococcus sp. HK05 TaxID=2725975 RepID=UPI001C391DC3|nr:ATP adenylyltransferase [Synechococcus sp. HK05]MBV2350832.1 ATP adenylyltransferase [Synechococcus sp. HK05]